MSDRYQKLFAGLQEKREGAVRELAVSPQAEIPFLADLEVLVDIRPDLVRIGQTR